MQQKDVQSRNVTLYKVILNCFSPAGSVSFVLVHAGGGGQVTDWIAAKLGLALHVPFLK